jgi:hypothetical protein
LAVLILLLNDCGKFATYLRAHTGMCVALAADIQMQSTKDKIGGRMKGNLNQRSSSRWVIALGFAALTAAGCAGGPLTAREKGAGIGAVGGAAAGGLIGAAAGRPALGAAIGGGVGLGAGALIGDYMQGQDEAQYQYNQQQIQQNQRVIEQNRREVQTQRQRQEY